MVEQNAYAVLEAFQNDAALFRRPQPDCRVAFSLTSLNASILRSRAVPYTPVSVHRFC